MVTEYARIRLLYLGLTVAQLKTCSGCLVELVHYFVNKMGSCHRHMSHCVLAFVWDSVEYADQALDVVDEAERALISANKVRSKASARLDKAKADLI